MDKIRAILFGMTGFGNNALEVLLNHPSIETIAVFTPKRQAGPFPYYECEKLEDAVLRNKISLYEGLNFKDEKTYNLIKKLSPHIIIVSSFNQIIPKSIIFIPKLGVINIHPSLLPKYRGATPTVWVLMNGEEETGVTAHFIEDETIDSGRIIAQTSVQIEPMDTDGSLRQKLANVSETVLIDAINRVLNDDKTLFPLQNKSEATYYPKRSLKDGEIDTNRPLREIINKIRAVSPYPGAYLRYKGIRYIISKVSLPGGYHVVADIGEDEEILVDTADGILRLRGKKVMDCE